MVKQEFRQSDACHRLVDDETGETTQWASYIDYTYLNGKVGYTAYYGPAEGVVTPEEFMAMTAVCKELPSQPEDDIDEAHVPTVQAP